MSLLTNGDFNTNLNGWSNITPSTGPTVSDEQYEWSSDISGCAQKDADNGDTPKLLAQPVTLEAAKSYSILISFRMLSGLSDSSLIYLFQETFNVSTARSNIAIDIRPKVATSDTMTVSIYGYDSLDFDADADLLTSGDFVVGSSYQDHRQQIAYVQLEEETTGGGSGGSGSVVAGENVFTPGLTINPGAPYTFDIDRTLYANQSSYGVKFPCFDQIMQCDDRLTLNIRFGRQFYADGFPRLKIIDQSDDSVLKTIDFTNINDFDSSPSNTNFWYVDYDPSAEVSNPICDKTIYLEIYEARESPASETLLATSEPICVRNSWPQSKLLKYKNHSDAFDMGYAQESPEYFNHLRVNSRMYKKSFPKQTREYRRSDGETIKLRSNVEKKIEFETDWLPYYMHEKLNIVFEHNTIVIDGTEFISQDGYEIEAPENYSLSRARANLTYKNYLQENLI